MIIRPSKLSDYKELVDMYKELISITYDGMTLGEDIFFYGVVTEWFKANKNIVICETDDGDIAGFTLAYMEDIGVVEPYYYGDIAYVKPKYRKTKAAYLLYNNVVQFGKSLGVRVIAKAYVGGGNKDNVDKIQSKFGNPHFIEYRTGE